MLRAGKLPPALLADLLRGLPPAGPRIIVGPGVGRDAAVIEIDSDRVLVATSDPITFAAEDIGWYAVNVNANDIACMGAEPKWFLATLLLPDGADEALPATIFDQMVSAARALNVTLVGGHTEVTRGIERPIVTGTMLGEARRGAIVTGEGITAGDAIILAGDIAIEGTALLAKEAADLLLKRGSSEEEIARAAALLHNPGISVVDHARLLCSGTRPRLMHDPTEGGIATALHELASAAGATLCVDLNAVPILDETAAICERLELDPLGLLASGALLAIVPAADVERVTKSPGAPSFRVIGRVEAGDQRVILEPEGPRAIAQPLPMFDRDELARFFDGMAGGR